MNLETSINKSPKISLQEDLAMDDFDFKPITSGLGFHQTKTTEIKPVFAEKNSTTAAVNLATIAPVKKDMHVYQNDLSLFYNQHETQKPAAPEIKEEKIVRLASTSQRLAAFVLDLMLILSLLTLVMTVMARMVNMDLLEMWATYPLEISPLALTLFSGFYMLYFSIFEKTAQSTLGKGLLKIRVVGPENTAPAFLPLVMRTFVTLVSFTSLGLFAYFDLQNKITDTKIVQVN
jgi:uncharacterized RDD family membrane protein YckC